MATGQVLLGFIGLYKLIKAQKADIIHVNGSRACLYAGLVGRILNIPVIWHVRETKKDLFVYDLFLSIISNSIICVSRSTKVKRFGRFGTMMSMKIHIAYNGVDTYLFNKNRSARQKIRRQFNVGDHLLFGIVGNLIPLKGHDFFLKGLAEAKKLQPDFGAKAIFIGRFLDAEDKKRLYRLTADLKLQDDVIFNGFSDNIPAYLSALDVFSLPSQREGCSRALLEAMSVGLPVIASKISEIEEVVRPDKNAILVEYGDVSQMAAAIIELAENKKLREMLGRENRNRAQTVFGMRSHVDSIQHVYEKLLMKTDKKSTYAHCI